MEVTNLLFNGKNQKIASREKFISKQNYSKEQMFEINCDALKFLKLK